MFVEKKLNKSGSTSVRIMQKVHGRLTGCESLIYCEKQTCEM